MGWGWKILVFLGAMLAQLPTIAAPRDWENTLTVQPHGDFPNPRPLTATYSFGWNDLVAARAQVRFDKKDDQLQFDGTGETVGLVRPLWKLDVRHRATADAATLHPISMHQVDEGRNKVLTTDVTFSGDSLERTRIDSRSKKSPKTKKFSSPGGVFDMFSALLYLRSQPLRQGDVYRVVVYPATNAYLATLTVVGRERLAVEAGDFQAIKLDVQLKKIGKDGELEPHKKFRRASVWISDDDDRLLLRIVANVFVGNVFAELQSVRFPTGQH